MSKLTPADHVDLKNKLQVLINQYGADEVQDATAVLLDLAEDRECTCDSGHCDYCGHHYDGREEQEQ